MEHMQVLNYVVKVLFFIGCHELSLMGDNKGGMSVDRGVFLDMLGLLSEDNGVLFAHLNISFGSDCKLTSPEI